MIVTNPQVRTKGSLEDMTSNFILENSKASGQQILMSLFHINKVATQTIDRLYVKM